MKFFWKGNENMKSKMMNITKVKTKIISAVIVAVLTVTMVGIISVSAAITYVDSGTISKFIYGNNWFASQEFSAKGNAWNFYSMPTYGNISKEGPYCLGVDKDGFLFGTQVLGRNLNLYNRMANTSDSVFLGKTSGEKFSFSVYSRNGSDGAKFYLTRFHGEARQ